MPRRQMLRVVNARPITAMVFINDNEARLHEDDARRLDFGLWERVFYGAFDGRRRMRVLVKIIGK